MSYITHFIFSILPLILTLILTRLKDRFNYLEYYFFHNQSWHKDDILLSVVATSFFLSIEILLIHYYVVIYWKFTKNILLSGLLYWIIFTKHKLSLNNLGISQEKLYLNIFTGFIFYFSSVRLTW